MAEQGAKLILVRHSLPEFVTGVPASGLLFDVRNHGESAGTMTTLGYGDLVLDGSWRILASLQAANGAIIIGWTTALIFFFIGRIYSNK